MTETKRDDQLAADLRDKATQLQKAARVRVPPPEAELLEDAARLMFTAADRLNRPEAVRFMRVRPDDILLRTKCFE